MKVSLTSAAPPLTAAVALLDRAARECTARADTPTPGQQDLAVWHVDAQLVRVAAETLRLASGTPLAQLPPWQPAAGLDPLELLRAAWEELQEVPDELANLPLFLGRLRTSDALSAVRRHYE